MAGDENVIDNAVVRITPDLKGFDAKLKAQLAKELAKVQPTLSVKLIADKTGFVASVYKELREVKAEPQFKVKLVADARGFAASARKALRKEQLTVNIGASGGRGGRLSNADKEAEKEAKKLYKRLREDWEIVERDRQAATQRAFTRIRGIYDAYDRDHQAALAQDKKRVKDAADQLVADRAAAEKKATAVAQQESARRGRIAEQESARRRKDLEKATKSPKLIDFGGEGVKPTNLLLGAVTALTPALFAMGTSAVQAASSVAALGAAGVGAALGISSLAISFNSISEVLALRKTVQGQDVAKGAKAAATSVFDAAEAARDLADAQRDEKSAYAAIHAARREAVRDLQDLRQAVVDLDNQYKSDRLSVREAQRDERATNANFFATALDRARAHQDTLDAKTRLSDTRLERRQKTQDLARSLKTGIEGSDKVRDARERARDARDRRLDAQSAGAKRVSAAMGGTSSAASLLEQKLAELSPAAREMYYWFDRNEEKLKSLRRTVEQGTLPGFTRFLEAVSSAPKGGKSTLQLAAEYAAELGGIIGKYVAVLGVWSKSVLFRSKMATIQKNNAEAFDTLGKAALLATRALLRIFAAASPLLVKFADKMLELATRFDVFIENAETSGRLGQWFKDAAVQAKAWWEVITSVAEIFKNVFTAALPAGGSLVGELGTFLENLAKQSGTASGQEKIGRFFQIFRDLPYAQIGHMLVQFSELFLAKHAAMWAAANPVFTALGLLAASNPAAATKFLAAFSSAFEIMATAVGRNPELTATILALVALAKLNKASGGFLFKFTGLDKIPGLGGTSPVMNVQAGVVNVYGGAGPAGGIPGRPGKPGVPLRGGAPAAVGGGLINGVTIAAIVAAVFANQQFQRAQKGEGLTDPFKNFAENPSLGSFAGTLQNASPIGLAAFGLGKAAGSVSITNGIIAGVKSISSKTLGERLRDPLGTMMSDAVAIGAGLATTKPKSQADAFARLDKDTKNFHITDPNAISQVVSRTPVQDYIARRKADVAALVEQTRQGPGGDKAARQVEIRETQESARVLSIMLERYGLAKSKAQSYSNAIYDLNTINYKFRQEQLETQNQIGLTGAEIEKAGKKAKGAAGDVGLLSTKLDLLSGERRIVLTVNGLPTVINDLEQVAIYQQLIRTGQRPTEANIRRMKNQFAKHSNEPNLTPAYAAGGRVYGYSPHDKSDNIPAMLTANEYVQPVAAVKHYGTDFMDAVRTRRFPKYAEGGPVTWAFPVGIPAEATTVAQPPDTGYTAPGGGKAVGSVAVAELAEATARQMGATTKQLIALMAAGIVESGLRNINYGDRDSVGFLQQRPSQGWGTVAQLTDPAYATRKFIQSARQYDKAGISAGELAARIQRPAAEYRGRYALHEADAVAVLNRFAPFIGGDIEVGTPGAGGTKAGLVAFGRWLQARGYQVGEHPAFGRVGRHSDNSQHYRESAIDVNHGAGASAAEQAALRKILPEGHRRGFRSIFMDPRLGHYDHAHFDLGEGHANGGLIRKFDTGGILPPGFTLAFNGTGKNETIRTARQEQNLGQSSMRLDRRDVALLAGAVNRTGAATVNMDGRRVAELTNRYNYLPAGV